MNFVGRTAVLMALAFGALSHWTSSAIAADEFDKYALESVSVSLSTTQAGDHPDVTTAFQLSEKNGQPYGFTRDIEVALPPGLVGNPQAVPRCSVTQLGNLLDESECPQDSQVGVTEITLTGEVVAGTFIEPIYNMDPPGGNVVARLGFFAAAYPAFINVRIDPTDGSLAASLEGAPSAAGVLAASTTLWGVPAAPSHDELRLDPREALQHEVPAGGRKATLPEAPFMSNPTDCTTRGQISITARSYQLPNAPSTKIAPFPQIIGCGKLSFQPRFTAIPTNTEAAAPTGLDAGLVIPQDETPKGLATSTLRSAAVTLPAGLTINPAAGDGLDSCSSEQVGFERNEDSHCPDASKIGLAEIHVPALEHVLKGAVYQRTPEPGHLFHFWLVADELGVNLKLPAEIDASPLTGQLTTIFPGLPKLGGNPQVPVSELKLHFFGGPRAPLATPSSCGTYQTHYVFSPWSGKPPAQGDTSMQIESGCGKGGFAPGLRAGMKSLRAGSFSPFMLSLTRSDGEANPLVLGVTLAEGLLAKLKGVQLCPDSAAAIGACPPTSKVGTIAAAAGVGGAPLWIPQPGKAPTAVYLAGPYQGAPYSIVSIVPAQAGPFDLGTVVNRASIYINPETAIATIKTDPLPQIIQGVPVAYRNIHVDVDRKDFTLNPTDCGKKQIRAKVSASNGATATPTDAFQATNCAKLPYKPKLKLSFKGGTKRTSHPAVRAVLTQKPHQANTKSATVLLPSSEFIEQSHIGNPCTRVQFNADNCPTKALLGHATAITPLLDKPLKGPVWFRSNGGARELPDIVADLHGQIHITLVGYVDSVGPENSEVRHIRTRFANVPDAPVTKFTMNLFGGRKGLIVNSRDLCKTNHRAKIHLAAQNGLVRSFRPVIATGCAKARTAQVP
jgi:hypothetical protein